MKLFIAHKFRGVNRVELKKKLEIIISILEKKGYQTFSYFRDKENWKPKSFPQGRVIKEAFGEIKKCDAILCFVNSKELSEGMSLETGFAKALNKKIILVISKKYSFPTLEAISDKIIRFNDLDDLIKKLSNTKI